MEHCIFVPYNKFINPGHNGAPLYIVDIDGTVADINHRVHHVQKIPKDFKSFFDAQKDDTPCAAMSDIIRNAKVLGRQVAVITGRQCAHLELTRNWLTRHKIGWDFMYMRKSSSRAQDTVVKMEALNSLRGYGANIVCAFEDRPSVLRVWRDAGITCFAADDRSWFPERLQIVQERLALVLRPDDAALAVDAINSVLDGSTP